MALNFGVCLIKFYPTLVHSSMGSGEEVNQMDEFLFDELTELEIVELIDRKNELLNELEADNAGEIQISEQRRSEIHDEIEKIYENLDLIY